MSVAWVRVLGTGIARVGRRCPGVRRSFGSAAAPIRTALRRWADRCAAVMVCGAIAVSTLLWESESRARAVALLLRPGSSDLVAYLIARPEDCRSHHELLRTVELQEVRGRLGLGGVLLLGDPGRAAATAEWLRREFPEAGIVRPHFHQRRLLRELGWHGPPRFVVLDRRSRAVTLAVDAPVTLEQQRAVRSAVIAVARQ